VDFSNSEGSVGERNVEAVREKLEDEGIPIVAEDVGGDYGRSVEFDVMTGELMIKTANGVKEI
ncbi:MAG: chemotaxis protein CheD, partial [Halobacteria archaeon]|nr:chemotaxis protein CheD [Halobacteria archaeon]